MSGIGKSRLWSAVAAGMCIFSCCALGTTPAHAYQMDKYIVNSAGNTRSSTAGHCVNDSLGEAALGQMFTTHYSIQTGYFSEYFLPAPTPTCTPVAPTPTLYVPQASLKIYSNQINPLRQDKAVIKWSQPRSGPATVAVYNLLGDKIAVLMDGQTCAAGQFYQVSWDGRNSDGVPVGSGIYIITLHTERYSDQGKVAVVK